MELIFNKTFRRAVFRYNGTDLTTLSIGQLCQLEAQIAEVKALALADFIQSCAEVSTAVEKAVDFNAESDTEGDSNANS